MTRRFARQFIIAAISTTSLGLVPGIAYAQEVAPDAPPPPQDPSAPPAEASGDPNEIIVTARRRNESLQDTPVAITAINAAMLENKASTNIGDLQGAAPNLLITQQNSGAQAANLSIRGLTYADIEKSQEPTVGVVIDGVFIGTNTGQLLDFFDIDQIEVLRGPQGTLFGRNTIGGVIQIRRSRPTMEMGAKFEASLSKWNTWAARTILNVGDGESLGAKGWYFHNGSDGFYRDGVTGKRRGGSDNENFGASFLFKPKGTDFNALLTLEKQNQEFDVVNSNIARTGELFCAFEPPEQCNRNTTGDLYTVFVSPATSKYSAPSATLEMNYDLGDVTLTSITGFRKSKENQTQDFDGSTTDLYYVLRKQNYRQFSQEMRASGKVGSRFDYVLGGFYFKSKYDLTQWTRLFGFNTSIDPRDADANAQSVTGKTTSYAVFGDFNWEFIDRVRLSGGGRWTHDKKSLLNSFATSGVVGQGSDTFQKFTPKIGLDYRPTNDVMVYASWSRGYRSGGFSPRAATAATAGVAYQPETVDSYEIGTKLDLFDRKLQLNLAGFVSKYNDLQQNTTIPGGPTGNQTVTSNVGSADIKGLEADFTFRPVRNLKFNGTVGILKSNFNDFIAGNSIGNVLPTFTGTIPAGAAAILALPATDPFQAQYLGTPTLLDYSKNRMIYSPRFTASLNAEYKLELNDRTDLVFSAGYRHIGRYDQQISLGPITGTLPDAAVVAGNLVVTQPTSPVVVNGNDRRVRTDRQGLLDASLTANFKVRDNDAYVTLWTRNLLDDRGTTAAFTVAGLWSFASAREPRTFGITIGGRY